MGPINERRQELERFRPRLNRLIEVASDNVTDDSYGPVSNGVIRLLLLELYDAQKKAPSFLTDSCLACGKTFPLTGGFFMLKNGRHLGFCSGHCISDMS